MHSITRSVGYLIHEHLTREYLTREYLIREYLTREYLEHFNTIYLSIFQNISYKLIPFHIIRLAKDLITHAMYFTLDPLQEIHKSNRYNML